MTVRSDRNATLIRLPVKVLLTRSGVEALSAKGDRIRRYLLSDSSEEPGIQLSDFTPPTLQKLVFLGYVSKVEMPLEDVVGTRSDVMDFAKLITYALLYRQFDTAVYNIIIQSDLVHDWNRRNPKKPIDFKTKVKTDYLQSILDKNANAVEFTRTSLAQPVLDWIELKTTLQSDEKRVQRLLMDRFLDHIAPLSWFLLTAYADSPTAEQTIRDIRAVLQRYLDKAVVGEYLGLMILELLSSLNPSNTEETVFVLWKFNQRKDVSGDRQRLHIVLSNDADRFREVKDKVHLRAGIDVGERSLQDFYASEGQSEFELNLGLYYLSFLNDACKRLNVLFESFVNRSAKTDRTLINIVLTF